ncbi:DUF805 domain-containing protein [Pantoea sp. CTOTU46764]|uniref:DUF805 domain-containing protein n=1 Tax=Pantoea sp. CTOTU46764 TaxID=2953854 RepID=UPI00289FDDD5|nr:DUF805 domain-containing protein [Pantoea sp. CTOTU46764]
MMNDRLAECYARAWRKTFDYKGCATCKEFWSFILVSTLPFLFAGAVLLVLHIWVDLWVIMFRGIGLASVMSFFSVIIIFPFMSLGIRRMHDIGRSGWWFGFLFIGSVFYFL